MMLLLLFLTAFVCQPFSLAGHNKQDLETLFLKMAHWSVYQVQEKNLLNKMCIIKYLINK